MLAKHYRPEPGARGQSWLTFLGHTKDSLWSVDLFRCESLILKTHWVMVVMNQCSRRIIGFGVHTGILAGPAVCCLFNRAISGTPTLPCNLSTNHDPLFEFHRWKANLRILEVTEVKTVPYVPLSLPFIKRLIGTIRWEFLDLVPFWNARDLDRKLIEFQDYYSRDRVHRRLGGAIPDSRPLESARAVAGLDDYRWKPSCRGLYELPFAA